MLQDRRDARQLAIQEREEADKARLSYVESQEQEEEEEEFKE